MTYNGSWDQYNQIHPITLLTMPKRSGATYLYVPCANQNGNTETAFGLPIQQYAPTYPTMSINQPPIIYPMAFHSPQMYYENPMMYSGAIPPVYHFYESTPTVGLSMISDRPRRLMIEPTTIESDCDQDSDRIQEVSIPNTIQTEGEVLENLSAEKPKTDGSYSKTNSGSLCQSLVETLSPSEVSSLKSPVLTVISNNMNKDFPSRLEEESTTLTNQISPPKSTSEQMSRVNSNSAAISRDQLTQNDNEQKESTNSNQILFDDDLIKKSLKSIESINSMTKSFHETTLSQQCNSKPACFHRSTQTKISSTTDDLIEEYADRAIKLIDRLTDDLKHVYQSNFDEEFRFIAKNCDELRQMMFFMHHIATSTNVKCKENLHPDTIDQLANSMRNRVNYSTSLKTTRSIGSGTVTSTCRTNHPSLHSSHD